MRGFRDTEEMEVLDTTTNNSSQPFVESSSACDLVDRFRKALDVVAGNTGNRYSAVFGSVDRVLE